jgi:hypothetical protein
MDFPRRLIGKFHRLPFLKSKKKFEQSDSENTRYSAFVSQAIVNESTFLNFRRNHHYREILEHVSYPLGLKYLNKIKSYGISTEQILPTIQILDSVGRPRIFDYPELGQASPTSLRYIAISAEIQHIFNFQSPIDIAEVGVGYGGQYVALARELRVNKFMAYDLPQVQELMHRFVSRATNFDVTEKIKLIDIYNLYTNAQQLFISNYAFSELPRNIQLEYLTKVASNSDCGYMIMNSGLTNYTGRTYGKLPVSTILENLPATAEIFPEWPNSGPDNYLLVWGHQRNPTT